MTTQYYYRCASGFYIDLLIELSEKLQFTYDIYEVEDKAWGGKNRKGEWNGLIRDILESKADLAMTSLKITTERTEIIDFSMPFMGTVRTKACLIINNLKILINVLL